MLSVEESIVVCKLNPVGIIPLVIQLFGFYCFLQQIEIEFSKIINWN